MTTAEEHRAEHAADVVLTKRQNGGYVVTKDRRGHVPRIVSAAQGEAIIREYGPRAIVREGAQQ